MQQSKRRRLKKRSKTHNQCSQLLSLTNLLLLFLLMKLLRIMTDTIQMVRFAPISSNSQTIWLLRCAEEQLKLGIYLMMSKRNLGKSKLNLRIISLILVQVSLYSPIVTRAKIVLASITP